MGRFETHIIAPGDVVQLAQLIESLLQTKGMRSGSAKYQPLLNTVQHISDLQARTVLVQKNVQDPDFLAEHSAYYSKWSYKVPRFCYRLHFFSEEPISDKPLEIIDQMARTEDSYLGFITLRPISITPLAATILKPPHQNNQLFILAKDSFEVNIAGQQFFVTGTPFMQQDNAVGACAQASIWMALRTLRRKEGVSAFNPAQITTAATRFYVRGRTLPNREGLAVEQITEALRAAGYSPHMIPLRLLEQDANNASINDAKQALYPYIESGLPVLLLLYPSPNEGHAVLLIGHGWESNPSTMIHNPTIDLSDPDSHLEIYDASSWVNPFYIHNDNTGPYLRLSNNGSDDPYSLNDAVFAIPFLQPDVFIDAAEAKLATIKCLTDSLEDLKSLISSESEFPKLVLRTYLQDRSVFRICVVKSDMPSDVKSYYRNKWLPRRIWITEINLFFDYGTSPNNAPIRVGEIIIDPSSEPEDGCFLSIHLGPDLLPHSPDKQGIIIDRNAFNGKIEAFLVNGDRYSPLVRH